MTYQQHVDFQESCSLLTRRPSCHDPQGLNGSKPLIRLTKRALSTAGSEHYYYDYF